MKSYFSALVEYLARKSNRLHLVIAVDFLAVIIAVPLALQLGHITVPDTAKVYVYWLMMPLIMGIVFPRYRLYSSLWRFASSSDFLNVVLAVIVTSLVGFAVQAALSFANVLPPIDGRAFIIFALLLGFFVTISRIIYRFLSDRFSIGRKSAKGARAKSAIFIGSLSEAALAMRQLSVDATDTPRVAVILATDNTEMDGTYLSGVIVRRGLDRLGNLITESQNGALPLTHLIIGNSGFESTEKRVETIRQARAAGLTVMTFRGVEKASSLPSERLFREVDVLTLLNRPQHKPDEEKLRGVVAQKRVLVTGGAGSIGSQLARRCLMYGAAQVVIVDRSEAGVFHWLKDLPDHLAANAEGRIADVSSEATMSRVFADIRPDIVFHAAALKHVPLVETNWASAIHTNVYGAWVCAKLAKKYQAAQFVLISTDKAVEPTTFLGHTKRFGEIICGAMNLAQSKAENRAKPATQFTSVRFGNVFGTEGSVVNVFEEQIRKDGPLTITHPEMKRYFMTPKEASDLVLTSAALSADSDDGQSLVYVLEMGEQIKIIDIANAMIRLAGKNPGIDVEIKVTGIRQYEKLEEKLVADWENVLPTENENILITRCPSLDLADVESKIDELMRIAAEGDYTDAHKILSAAGQAQAEPGVVIPLQPKRVR